VPQIDGRTFQTLKRIYGVTIVEWSKHLTENYDLKLRIPFPVMPAIFQLRIAKKIKKAHSVRVKVNFSDFFKDDSLG